MNIFSLLFAVFSVSSNAVMSARLGGKGNMRGVVTRYSGLSPREAALLRLMLKRKRYGIKCFEQLRWKYILACLNKLKQVSLLI